MKLLMNNTLSKCRKGNIKGSSPLSKSNMYFFILDQSSVPSFEEWEELLLCLSSLTRIDDNLSLLFLAGTDIITKTLLVFDAIVIFICIVSLFLCGRSVYRSLKLAMVRYIYKQSKKKLRGNNLVKITFYQPRINNLVGPNCNQLPAGHTHYFFDTFFSQVEYVSFFKLLQHYYSYWPFFPFFPFLFF